MEVAWSEMKTNISLANRLNATDAEVDAFHDNLKAAMRTAVARCRAERKRKLEGAAVAEMGDDALREAARFTDGLPLADYGGILNLVPRLVNIVTLAEAIPVPGSGTTLPLDLHAIGARCTNAYYAPKRFAAVQLAFSNPRCRVLAFHTGRLVGTGCAGPNQARLAILKAARQLAVEANVHVTIRKFEVINQARLHNSNTHVITSGPQGLRHLSTSVALLPWFAQVGAVSINAKLDCDAFASTHSATSHYDRASFVGTRARARVKPPATPCERSALTASSLHRAHAGLAWRPGGEKICCEIYSTGKVRSHDLCVAVLAPTLALTSVQANLPGSTRQRDLLTSFARMVSELLRHSDRPEVCEKLPEHLRLCHRPQAVARDDAPVVARSKAPAQVSDLFGGDEDEDWALAPLGPVSAADLDEADADDLLGVSGFC